MKLMKVGFGLQKGNEGTPFLFVFVNDKKTMALAMTRGFSVSSVSFLRDYWSVYDSLDESGKFAMIRIAAALHQALHEIVLEKIEDDRSAANIVIKHVRSWLCLSGCYVDEGN